MSNPLQEVLTPAQFQQCVNFYEADQKLDHAERVSLANQLQSIALKSNVAGYVAGMVGFSLPTIYYGMRGLRPTPLFAVQRPFFSLVLGFGTLMAGGNLTAKYLYEKAKQEKYTDPNISNVWKTLEFPVMNFYTFYYTRTAMFPLFIIRDPRTCTYSAEKQNPHFTEALNLGQTDNTGKEHPLSVWDKVRINHGFNPSDPKK
ncbi:conserved hypothetical protein [Candida tropicalis MYA-3404]|uniref:Transmembrane protein n=1 Tax=Candida tropicalis (strain ATCC MYA-3404 / T1) TaxID=294747 RepID=C5MHL4_CANTT|nr:conserved hypothetical protein [Candida tropicalis MYA-3404]EER30779.1 conserved hypothetical protein [Candida tropicalis MYA-3404]KAG4404334.1 hypothetical protein JTP64_006086 [Candida tropicalis]